MSRKAGSTQQCITDGMNQNISVGMGNRTFIMWNFNTADYQFPACGKLMNIVTKSDT